MNYSRMGKNRSGLTLIELLVTIAVVGIIAVMSIPIISNIISLSNERAIEQLEIDISKFVEKYNKGGAYTYDPDSGTFVGYVDLNGDGKASANEKTEELSIDLEKFTILSSVGDAPTDYTEEGFYSTMPSDTFSLTLGRSEDTAAKLFRLADNGITIICDNAEVGSSGTVVVNGVERTFTKYARANLNAYTAENACTSGLANMSGLFMNSSTFNGDISHWDTSDATEMTSLFANASSFNQDLSNWDVSQVTNMSNLFYNAVEFDQPLNSWNVGNVEYFSNTFGKASSFNQDLSNWDVSKAIYMVWMFKGAGSFNHDLSSWNVYSVENSSDYDAETQSWTEEFKPGLG